MELQDLSHDEKLVCAALFKMIVVADGSGSSDEAEHAAALASAYGQDEFQKMLDEVGEKILTEGDLKRLVASIANQDSRDLIYGTVMECALAGGVEHSESEILQWLARDWDIEVKLLENGSGSDD